MNQIVNRNIVIIEVKIPNFLRRVGRNLRWPFSNKLRLSGFDKKWEKEWKMLKNA